MAKLEDIITQLQAVLPLYTDYFNDQVDISAVVNTVGDTYQITTSGVHGLTTNDYVLIKDVLTENEITTVIDHGNDQIQLTTTVPHDLTQNFDLLTPANHTVNVYLSGFSNVADGEYELLEVGPDGSNFIVSLSVVPTGTGFLNENRLDSVNGRKITTVIDTTNFTIEAPNSNFSQFLLNDDSKVIKNVRISGSGDPDKFIKYYTDQSNIDDLWLWVVPGDTKTSFSRNISSDANQRIKKSNQLVYECVQSFFIYVISPQTNSFGAREISDLMIDIRKYLCKSLVGVSFSSGFDTEPLGSLTTFQSDGFFSYVGAYYVHQFEFETVFNFNDRDAVDPLNSKAFRDVEINWKMNFDDYVENKKIIEGELP